MFPIPMQNTLEDLHNLMLATGTDDFSAVADESYLGRAALNPATDWNSFLGGSNDDAQVRHIQPLCPSKNTTSNYYLSGSFSRFGKLPTTSPPEGYLIPPTSCVHPL